MVKRNAMIDCFGKHKLENRKGQSLEEVYNEAIKGRDESEHRAIANKVALDFHKELFNEMEVLKKQVKGQSFKPTKYESPDKSDIVKKIIDEYNEKINALEKEVTQDTNTPTTTGKEQPLVTDIAPETKSGEKGKEPPPAEPTDTVGEGKGKFEEKARRVAEKIMAANITPDWLKIDDANASTKGASAEQVKKALADATIKMGRLLDKGVEFGEAVKEAVKDLVDLMGEGMRGKIEEGFAKDYKNETNYELSGIRKKLVSEKVIEGVDLEKVSDKDMMALGRKILDTGEVKPEALVTKIIEDGKGVLTPTEVVGLITYKRDIDTALQDTYKQLAERKAKGEDIGTLGVEAKNLERQINDFDVMAVITAQQQSMAFRLRQRMLDREYNVVTQIEKYKANNNGEIPADIEAKFRDLDKQIKEVKVKLAEAEKKLAEKEGQEAVDNIKESVGREKNYTEEELQAELKKERASLRTEKKSKVHKAIDELMDKWANKITPEHLKGTNTKGIDAEKVFKSVGAVMKKAYDAGETVTKIVEDAVNYISEKLGNKDWGIEEFKKENWEEKLKATSEKKAKDKPTINEDGTVSIPNEMLRDLVKRGITDINDLTKAVHEQVKKELPNITERQVRDYITDYGKKVNPTADQLQQQVNTAKRVGRLLSELEDIQNKIKKNKGSNNIKLTDKERELKRQINALSKDIFGKEEKSSEQRLADAKERTRQRIADLTLKIKKKDFAKPTKKLQPTDTELVELNRQKELLQEQYDKEQYKLELKNRKWWQKAEDIGLEIFTGISRTLVAGVDLSAGLVQGTWRLYRDPKMSMKAFGESLKQFASEKRNEEWFSKLKASGIYPIVKASKLAVTDEHGRVSVKEGMFITNWANAIYNGLANVATLGYKPAAEWVKLKNPIKASQRAFDGYINYVRVAEFVKLAEEAQKDGYTFESNPKIFEKLADHVNTTTGRGSMGALETSSKWLSVAMFAPRKVISEIKLFTPYAFAYYAKQPAYVRKKALLDFAKFVSSYVAVNTAIWAAQNAYKDDDDKTKFNDNFWNMNSSDFMTHVFGKTRIQLGGQGAKSALVFMSRLFTGEFTDQNGNTTKLGNRYGKQVNTRWDLVMNYGKGKASPGMSAVIKKLDERKGLEVDDVQLSKDLTIPMWMQDANELYKEHPAPLAAMFNILSILGAGVRVAEQSEKQKVNEELIKDPTYKFYSDKGVNFPELDPEKIITKKVNNKNVEKLSEYEQSVQDDFIKAKKKHLKEGLQSLKDGYITIWVDEDGGVSMPTTDAGEEGKQIIAFDKLTPEQLQALVSELGEQATEKTKEEIDLKTKKKKQQ